jgi:uncharacterized protein with gpF-like domain
MSWFKRKNGKVPSPEEASRPDHIPAVKFDASRVTEEIELDIKKNIAVIEGIEPAHFDQIYNAALRSISGGRDLGILFKILTQMNIDGMTKRRAEEIARSLNNKATVAINRERQKSLGIKYARWLYSGAPCLRNSQKPTDEDIRQDAAHKAANGKQFDVNAGLFLNGKWTWPGQEDGCRCISRSVVEGFS